VKRNKFSLSNYKLLTGNQGELLPIGLTEVLPGDTVQQATSALIRTSPLLAPVMHPVQARIHHWFVPHRLVWEDFEDFITGGDDGLDASVFPTIDLGGSGAAINSLADYLGVPTGVANLVVGALPFRGYQAIYNEWYRDADLITEAVIDKTSGADTTTDTSLQNVAWEKDYFTSASSDTQKGDEVTMPLGTSAPISGIGVDPACTWATASKTVRESDGSSPTYTSATQLSSSTTTTMFAEEDPNNAGYPNLAADLSSATAASINDLREAFALQRYAEARQRYGSRYTEYLRYLGVRSSDSRLQRPEYLGGGKQTIQFSEVLSTDGANTGQMKGHGIGAMRSNRYRRFFEEHGFVFSFISVKPKTIYSQGLPRHWNRRTKEDFFQKELQHIGMQPILNKEVYASHTTPEGTFAYQDRYDEYRRAESSISGEFRDTGGLEHWHMARVFSSDPALNQTFVEANPTNRIYASTTNDQLYIMANHSIQARRMLSRRGAPSGF
jgi:hypothetical protein